MKKSISDNIITSRLVKEGFLYSFKEWEGFPLVAFFSNRTIDFKDKLNRDRLSRFLGIKDTNLIIPHQEHGKKIELVNNNNLKTAFSCDALITSKTGVALSIRTADCLSVFLYDKKHQAIAIIHAGWRSSRLEIVKDVVLTMQKEFKTNPETLKAALGPAIRSCCYKVGEDMKTYFPEDIREKEGFNFLDLAGVNLKQLISAGISRRNIVDSQICNCCRNDEFFSYRKEGISAGRSISVIMLNEDETYRAKRT